MIRRKSGGVARKNAAASAAIDVLDTQALTAATDQISVGSSAAIAVKTIDNSTGSNITLTSDPCIEPGMVEGQILILRAGGTNQITIPSDNGTRLGADSPKSFGAADYMVLRWRGAGSEWEQVTAVQAN